MQYGGKPPQCLTDVNGQGDDINKDFGGEYVYIVPIYTNDPTEALTSVSIAIQGKSSSHFKDLAKGAGGDFRYIVPNRQSGANGFITNPRLMRSQSAVSNFGGFSGHTTDINKGRGGTFLYIVWEKVSI